RCPITPCCYRCPRCLSARILRSDLAPTRPSRAPRFFFHPPRPRRPLPSFPTRRSSDLALAFNQRGVVLVDSHLLGLAKKVTVDKDRKSTRLNSSHVAISYAVFCVKKKRRS